MKQGLDRFKITLAEIEGFTDICPTCSSNLVFVKPGQNDIPGRWATDLTYKYCATCNQYYICGSNDEDNKT